MTAGISARSAMDNALFAVDYWTVIGGLGLARITPGSTLQAEVTVLQLTRARGPTSAGRQPHQPHRGPPRRPLLLAAGSPSEPRSGCSAG